MALVYRPPGVRVYEVPSPNVSPLIAVPTRVCLIGVAQGYITRTDQFVLSGTTAVPLPGLPANSTVTAVVSVKDAIDPSKGAADGTGYVVTTDYTVNVGNGTITRVGAGAIADGTLVNVTYQYVPTNYYDPILLDDINAVEQRFGSAFTQDGTGISSVVSYAAGIAFENGAPDIVIQPLFIRQTPGDATTARLQPSSAQAASTSSWGDTLYQLRDYEEVNIVVPVIGQSAANVNDTALVNIFQKIQDHLKFMKNENQYIIGIFGEDSSASVSVATRPTLLAHAGGLAARYEGEISEQLVLISPSRFRRILPTTATSITVGGQYAAAAIAGMLAARAIQVTLTRRQLSGFAEVMETRTKAQKNEESGSGLLVIEQKGFAVQCRHSLTLNTDEGPAKAELSVVRAKHHMIESVRDTLERQIIGKIIADENATAIVESAVTRVLEVLRQRRELVGYSKVSARLGPDNPTKMEVRFSYRPAFPVNYIDVYFSVDISGGGDVQLVPPNWPGILG
jgi:hypothetical protein